MTEVSKTKKQLGHSLKNTKEQKKSNSYTSFCFYRGDKSEVRSIIHAKNKQSYTPVSSIHAYRKTHTHTYICEYCYTLYPPVPRHESARWTGSTNLSLSPPLPIWHFVSNHSVSTTAPHPLPSKFLGGVIIQAFLLRFALNIEICFFDLSKKQNAGKKVATKDFRVFTLPNYALWWSDLQTLSEYWVKLGTIALLHPMPRYCRVRPQHSAHIWVCRNIVGHTITNTPLIHLHTLQKSHLYLKNGANKKQAHQ